VAGESVPAAMCGLVRRNRRRYGGYIVHAGVVLSFAGIAGSAFNLQVPARLAVGESMRAGDYTLTYERPASFQDRNKQVVAAELAVVKEGRALGYLKPERAFYPQHEQPVSEVAILGGFWEDLYVVLSGMDEKGEALLQVFVNPLVGWIWAGGWVMVVGTLVAVWPERRRRRAAGMAVAGAVREKVARPAAAVAGALVLLLWSGAASAAPTVDEVAAELVCSCGCSMTAGNCTHEGCGGATAMKEEIGKLLRQGRTEGEILADFARRYGDQVLAAPPKRGFNLTAWLLPFAAIGLGGLGLYALLKRWAAESRQVRETPAPTVDPRYAERVHRELEEWKEAR
jgi:cytochrome c-type biogenesis protein CcmF